MTCLDACTWSANTGGVVLASVPVLPSGRLQLRLLGPIELRREGALIDAPDWRRERVRSLLAFLVLHHPVSRARLSEELWPHLGPDAQSRNLRVTLTYLLRVLEPDRHRGDPSFFVRQHGGNLTLHADTWLDVDVWQFELACQEGTSAVRTGEPALALERLLQATDLWRGEPTELSEPWAVAPVERWRRQFTEVVIRAGELHLAQQEVTQALALAERALEHDPWSEAAHRLVVAAHCANHDDLAVRRALGRYDRATRELGVSAGEATRLAARLLEAVPPMSAIEEVS